ncbi:glycosyltransferase [Roseomonas sp. AR75]|uniref:glycosyltransferase n=1 Tax=Roseomonas sp. AR75 TaxID=2562311 RepID=UPI0010C0685D|nr:glycosyltransferase [Roseomonas sp. AR75]
MTRILLWFWGRRGGGAQFALSLARALAPGGLALSVSRQNELIDLFRGISVPRQEVSTYNGVAGFVAGFARVPGLAAGLSRFAREQETPVVVSAMAHPWTPFVAPALTRAGLAFIPAIHDAVPHPGDPAVLFDWRLRRELEAARAAIVFSDAVAQAVAARRPDLRLIRLPLGALLPFDVAPTEKRADVLFFGRFRRYKGLDLLRDAWPALRAAHPGATLRVVGEGDAEALAPGLAALPGVTLEQRWVPDAEMAGLVAGARLLVLPYREASQSGVLPVALACGVPVVATDVGGLAEQLRGSGAGLLVPPEPAALAAAMARLLDPAAHAAFAEAARAAGARLNDWDGMAAALREEIARVLR